MKWISRTLHWFRQSSPPTPGQPHPEQPPEPVPSYALMLQLLERIGAPVGHPPSLRYAFVSADRRYWSVTLENLQSYLVDTQQMTYLHYPNASAEGFEGAVAIMIPDEIRFSLGPYGEEQIEVALCEPQPWIELPRMDEPPLVSG